MHHDSAALTKAWNKLRPASSTGRMKRYSGFARRQRAVTTAARPQRRTHATIALVAATAAIAIPGTAQAAAVPVVSSDTLTVTGDGADDRIALRVPAPGTLRVETNSETFDFDRATFHKIAIRAGGGADTVRIENALTESVTIE